MVARPKNPRPKSLTSAQLNKRYTFEEARGIKGPFVYGLEDRTGVFYIGKTIDASRRFYQYVRPAKTTLKLQRRIRDAHGEVLVRILHHNPEDLVAAEYDLISLHAPNLVNQVGNLRHFKTSVPSGRTARLVEGHIANCPKCDGDNFRDGKHLCTGSNRLEVLNPKATGIMQEIFVNSGIMREEDRYSVPREKPNPF